MTKQWNMPDNPEMPILEQVLKTRHLSIEELSKTLNDLPDEALLSNIEEVAERIREALYKNEPLVIFGHDDPDGITSCYVL